MCTTSPVESNQRLDPFRGNFSIRCTTEVGTDALCLSGPAVLGILKTAIQRWARGPFSLAQSNPTYQVHPTKPIERLKIYSKPNSTQLAYNREVRPVQPNDLPSLYKGSSARGLAYRRNSAQSGYRKFYTLKRIFSPALRTTLQQQVSAIH